MGHGQSIFETSQLEEYCMCTYFTDHDILRLYHRFQQLNPDKISPSVADVTTRLTFEEIHSLPELRANPFAERICTVFSTDGSGMNFEDFLDIFSVFSEKAPWNLKATYAFRIYDYNGDSSICREDIENVLRCLTRDSLCSAEMAAIARGVIQEADVAQNLRLTYAEFEHMISRAPDFINLFHITI